MSLLTEQDLKILGEGSPMQVRKVLRRFVHTTPERIALMNLCERLDRMERATRFVSKLLEQQLRAQQAGTDVEIVVVRKGKSDGN
jgi:hypothetical protein